MILRIGYSPCPNDTFMFDALVHKKIDTEELDFDITIADVEQLNKQAFETILDVTKISYHAYAHVADAYKLLTSGSALGNNNGPLLISKKKIYPDEVGYLKIAIPGEYTTANLLLGILYPGIKDKKEYIFSDIEDAILSNEVDAGLIIHENRFTYEKKGLKKIIDIGEYWENLTNLPIPLGGIIIKRNLNKDIQLTFNRVLKRSIEFAFKNPKDSMMYIKQYAQELDESVIQRHVNLYVNNYSIDIGDDGKKAIMTLYEKAHENKIIRKMKNDIFVS